MSMTGALDFLRSNPHLFATTVLAVSVLAAFVVQFITNRVLLRLTSKTSTSLDDEIVRSVGRPLFYSTVILGLSLSYRQLSLTPRTVSIFDTILITLTILLWTGAMMRIGQSVLAALARKAGDYRFIQTRTLPLFEIMVKTIIVGGAAYGLLLAWHVDVTAWLASAGILGIAIGFAAKDTLANLFSGIFILADAPYKIGDFIVLGSGERGEVTDIGIRSTRILTRDDIQIIIPNAEIGSAKIINESGGRHLKRRVRVRVGVAYGSDIDRVRELLLDEAAKSPLVVDDPEPRVRFRNFGDSSLDFELLGWIREPVERGRALDQLNSAVYKRFVAEGIQIPFPQRDVHLLTPPE
jgi:small-conductance mechanosensitive channel